MINSRNLADLIPQAKERVEKFIELCKNAGIDLLITSTYRDIESQNALYSQGRTTVGKIVTNAKGGDSYHNYRCAVDVVPLINGKPDWDSSSPIWSKLGKLGKEAGLEWAGDWRSFREFAHFQYTSGLVIAQLKTGNVIA
jgi:peptidoglycan L-alanyl-D-glutamate endopeptidase CwlK